MKKLIYLLALSLCLNGVSGAVAPWVKPAQAEEVAQGKAEKKSSKKKTGAEKQESEKDAKRKDKKAKAEKAYRLDLDGAGSFTLGDALKYAKLDIKLKAVKGIELADKKDRKRIAWEKDPENEKDYIFTVLKDFKTLQLVIKTKDKSVTLALENGAKPKEEASVKVEVKQAGGAKIGTGAAVWGAISIQSEPEEPPAPEEPEAPAQPVEKATEVPMPESVEEAEPVEPAEPKAEEEGEPIEPAEPKSAEEGEPMEPAEPKSAEEGEPMEPAAPESEKEGEPIEPAESKAAEEGEEGEGGVAGTDGGEGEAGGEDEGSDEGEAGDPEAEASDGDEGESPEQETGEASEGEEAPTGDVSEGGDDAVEKGAGATLPADAQAWFKRDNALAWGTLEAVLGQLQGGETVYIQSAGVILVKDAPLALLANVTLLPDESVFKGDYGVRLSLEDPAASEAVALLLPADLPALGEAADLYIWVAENAPEVPEEPQEKPTLDVKASGLVESGWGNTPPTFELSGIPEGKAWSYAAIIYDERFVPISENTYIPDQQGLYTLRFAMLDELGDIMSVSGQYTLQLDWTAPQVSVAVDEENSYTLVIVASDTASGVEAVSVDGGKTWNKLRDDEEYVVTAQEETTYGAGDIQVRDAAGNIFASEEDYTVEAVEGEDEPEEEEGGGGGGGGGGSGESKPVLPHASGDGDEGVEYDALDLEIPDAPMTQLTLGGEAMPLSLTLAYAQQPGAPVGDNQSFTATLRHWNSDDDDDAPDTLVLDARLEDGLGESFAYDWHFNGEVYRALANSGIRYVALKVGDTVAAFPTEGFTGGTRYTELKMQGVSTRHFDYTLTMKLNLDAGHVSAMTENDYSRECDLSIHAAVDGMEYELSSSPRSIMYFYNVFLGPEDMMKAPFGEYQAHS